MDLHDPLSPKLSEDKAQSQKTLIEQLASLRRELDLELVNGPKNELVHDMLERLFHVKFSAIAAELNIVEAELKAMIRDYIKKMPSEGEPDKKVPLDMMIEQETWLL